MDVPAGAMTMSVTVTMPMGMLPGMLMTVRVGVPGTEAARMAAAGVMAGFMTRVVIHGHSIRPPSARILSRARYRPARRDEPILKHRPGIATVPAPHRLPERHHRAIAHAICPLKRMNSSSRAQLIVALAVPTS